MNLNDLKRHLGQHGCEVLRDQGKHTVYINRANGMSSPVPRHADIKFPLVLKVCKELGIERPGSR